MAEVMNINKNRAMMCMTCHICEDLFIEATTITECVHTFCKECIHKEITENGLRNCPVCNVDLGCHPLTKLRPDHSLQRLRDQIFPIVNQRSRAKEVVLPEVASTDPLPLPPPSIDAPGETSNAQASVENTGNNDARVVVDIDINIVPEEADDADNNYLPGTVDDGECVQAMMSDDVPFNDDSHLIKKKNARSARKKKDSTNCIVEFVNDESAEKCVAEKAKAAIRSKSRKGRSRRKQKVVLDSSAFEDNAAAGVKDGNAFELKAIAEALEDKTTSGALQRSSRAQSEPEKKTTPRALKPKIKAKAKGERKDKTIARAPQRRANGGRKVGNKTAIKTPRRNIKAKGSEVAVSAAAAEQTPIEISDDESPIDISDDEIPIGALYRNSRVRKESEFKDKTGEEAALRSYRAKGKEKCAFENKGTGRAPTPTVPKTKGKGQAASTKSTSKGVTSPQQPISANNTTNEEVKPIWFSLFPKQGNAALPQLPSPYLKIKDRSMTVGTVRKYVAMKLNLASEDEVEILMEDKPLFSLLPLEQVAKWYAELPSTPKIIHATLGSSAEEFIMALTYARTSPTPEALSPAALPAPPKMPLGYHERAYKEQVSRRHWL